MRLEQVKTARPEERPAGGIESELPQAHTAQADFSLAVEHYGSESVLVLAGELDLFRAPAIENALAEVGHPAAVDLRMVTFIDVSTLVLLLGASRRQQAHGRKLLVLVGAQTPMTAFQATGFDRLLAITRLDNERRLIARTTSSERTGWSPPPHTTLDGRNTNGNNGSN
jgi:anti-anti-sigma factor